VDDLPDGFDYWPVRMLELRHEGGDLGARPDFEPGACACHDVSPE